MKTEIKKVSAKITSMSLIGVGKKRPVSWGNYFWIDNIRIVNMWAENLETLISNKTLEDKMIELNVYYVNQEIMYGLVIDQRIKSEWLYNKLCFTGIIPPTIEYIKDMYSIVGDPTNEIEQYENPKKYYEDRGWLYNSNGSISLISKKI